MSPRPLTVKRLVSQLGRLSAPLGRPAIAKSTDRLLATDPSSRPLGAALQVLAAAYEAFPSKLLIARGLGVAARLEGASDLDLIARLAGLAEPMLSTVSRAKPRAWEKAPTLLAAVSGSVLMAAAIDRLGGDSLAFVRLMISLLDRAGHRSVGFGLDHPEADLFADGRGIVLRVLIDASVAILASRALASGDDFNRGGQGGEPPLDDRLEPRPWSAYSAPEQAVAELVALRVIAEGDCWLRARANLATYASGRFLDRESAAKTFDELIRLANPDLRREFMALRAGAPAASALPQYRSSSRAPARPESDRCKACGCAACPMAGRGR